MKLDRNVNPNGNGKYALVNIRKLQPVLCKFDADDTSCSESELELIQAFNVLKRAGVLTIGNESPGDQFFVMKYKDLFTAPALAEYSHAVRQLLHANSDLSPEDRISLEEYAEEISEESKQALRFGNSIPE